MMGEHLWKRQKTIRKKKILRRYTIKVREKILAKNVSTKHLLLVAKSVGVDMGKCEWDIEENLEVCARFDKDRKNKRGGRPGGVAAENESNEKRDEKKKTGPNFGDGCGKGNKGKCGEENKSGEGEIVPKRGKHPRKMSRKWKGFFWNIRGLGRAGKT
jgi:hypothetical protein